MKLRYEKVNGSNDVLSFDLHNAYKVISITGFNVEKSCYTTTLFLKADDVDEWSLIEKAENIEFNVTRNEIHIAILKLVSEYLENGFFDYYIERYAYTLKCFDKGHEYYEVKRLEELSKDE